jgi:hypothetical protein
LGLQWLHIGNITWLRNVASQSGKTEKHQIGLNNICIIQIFVLPLSHVKDRTNSRCECSNG